MRQEARPEGEFAAQPNEGVKVEVVRVQLSDSLTISPRGCWVHRHKLKSVYAVIRVTDSTSRQVRCLARWAAPVDTRDAPVSQAKSGFANSRVTRQSPEQKTLIE
ncbi:hypothetical protein [Spirosoma litoris]